MATRRSHTKSRNGCRDCKRRKVKCDEAYPSCFNCTRHGIVCSLSSSQPSPNDISPQRPTYASSSNGSNPGLSPGCSRYDFLGSLADRTRLPSPAPPIELWGRGLELMHHYSLSTGDSLATRRDIQHVWRVLLPEIGYSCPFVMHGVLAMSALHKAYLIPSERETYLNLATAHQNAGLEIFRTELHMINNSNWQNFFCFASVVVLYVSSIPVRLGKETEAVPNIFELFVFVRGIRAILEPYHSNLKRTKFSAMASGLLTIDPGDANYKNPPMAQSPLPNDIFQALEDLASFFQDNLRDGTRQEYLTAVSELEKAVYLMAHAGTNVEVGMLLFWPYVISENIMADIHAQNLFAIVLLSYFAIPLCALEQRFWFLKGWSRRLFDVMDVRLKDHPSLMEMVKWPRRQVFELYRLE